jgi:hypothetical protein
MRYRLEERRDGERVWQLDFIRGHRLQEEEGVVLYFLNLVVKNCHCHKAQTSIKELD